MEMMLWNVVLSAIVAIMGFLLKGKFDELQRLSILLNTRQEFRADMQQLLDRFDRLERKIDRIATGAKADA